MPKILIPATVETVDGDGQPLKTQVSFLRFVRDRLLDTKFGVSTEKLYAAMEIRGAFDGKEVGETVSLTEAQHRALVDATESPTGGYNVPIMIQLKPYLDAILKPAEK